MSILTETQEVARRTMTLFFVVDTSGSMAGSKIGAVNDAIVNVLPMLEDISSSNPDAEIKVAALEFSTECSWLYDEPKLAQDFKWIDMTAKQLTSLGGACRELNKKLSRTGFMKTPSGSFAPAIILLSDGEPTDDYAGGLAELKNNNWFKAAIKVAIAIGDDANKEELAKFTGTDEGVFTVHNIDALKQIIRIVAVTSSQIGSKSSGVGSVTKQETVLVQVKESIADVKGAEVASEPSSLVDYDEW